MILITVAFWSFTVLERIDSAPGNGLSLHELDGNCSDDIARTLDTADQFCIYNRVHSTIGSISYSAY
jgi:hypothetical protein